MSRRRKQKKPEVDLTEQLANEFARWDYLYQHGGSDPFYADGLNMNLVRNHIIYSKRQLEESVADGTLPEIYYKETPPEMDQNYMARTDEIRQNAAKTLTVYQVNEKYLWCLQHVSELTEKELKHSCIENILGYVTGLERAIVEDDLITMRRHERPGGYIDSFERGVQEINQIYSKRAAEPQLSLFSADAPQAGLNFSDGEDESEPDYDDEEQEISM